MKIELYDHQKELVDKVLPVLSKYKLCYLAAEVRTGKTLVALDVASKSKEKAKVLFVTKKKAISSITGDYEKAGYDFDLTVTNYQQLHKFKTEYRFVIVDEAHSCGAYPKPGVHTKELKRVIGDAFVLYLSGTPHPESESQIYHQFWLSQHSPFKKYASFYKWAHEFVIIRKIKRGIYMVNDYKKAKKDEINEKIKHLMVTYTQKQAGFTSVVDEETMLCEMRPETKSLLEELKKNKVVELEDGDILADTGAKMMQKCHQISSGTIKFEDGSRKVIDYSKAYFIQDKFKDKKIVIFYKFIAELEMLKEVFGGTLTTDVEEFKSTDKNIALQIVSGREGINLSEADNIVYLNIDFSATSYWQSRDRMTTKDRLINKIFWIFGDCGMERDIYERVMNKRNYTLSVFRKSI